jgi:hypothetical protein
MYVNLSMLAAMQKLVNTGCCGETCPFAPTRRKTVTHFRRFLKVLVYSLIGVKFPPITAPHTLYTVKKKNLEHFQYIFSFISLNVPN